MKTFNVCGSSRFQKLSLAAMGLALLLWGTDRAWAESGFSTNVQAQIAAMEQEKASFTPVEQKMDSQLVFAYKKSQNIPIAGGAVPQLRIGAQADTNGMIKVDITATVTPNLLKQILKAGGTIINNFPQYNAIRAQVPLKQVEKIAALPGLTFIKPAVGFSANNSDPEGVAVHLDDSARNHFHVDGSGVKVGVLSTSVDFLALAQSLGDLGAVTVLPGQSGVPSTGEGTAMLEIVHAMAPGAQLFFAAGLEGEASFAQNIINLRAAGCDVIVDDIGYFDESPFQDGIVAQAVNQVTASGALYFSSAGNSGNFDSTNSGTWEGDFKDGGSVTVTKGTGTIHSFGATNADPVLQFSGEGAPTVLFWSDPMGKSDNDYDLYIVAADGTTIVSSSVNVQNGSQDPYEIVSAPNTGEQVAVVLMTGTNRFLHIDTQGGILAFATAGNTKGHNSAVNAFDVAAAPAANAFEPGNPIGPFPGPFVAVSKVENFSSDGPRRMFYSPTGTPFTPTNFSSTGGVVLNKPDITAADGVTTSVPGFAPFFGTSAAAPHAAAIAALLKSYNPTLSEATVRTTLTNTAIDIMTNGWDQDSGFGIVMPYAALAVTPQAFPAPNLLIVTNIVSGGNGNGMIDYDECNSMDIILTNVGSAAATHLQATLSTTTPGVLVAVDTVSYPDIPIGGVATNSPSFKISTTPFFICGTPINFTLGTKSDLITTTNLFTLNTGIVGSPVRQDVFTNLTIPDNNPTGAVSTVVVSNVSSALTGVTVALNIIHPFVSDLTLRLTGPDGTTIILAQNQGGTGQNYGADCSDADRTTFDDNAGTSINGAQAPFIGLFQPEQPLSVFRGKSGDAVNGLWKLQIVDDAAEDVGTLKCWTLNLTSAACQDGGGQCPGVDLALGMVAAPSPVAVLSNLTYTISVTNNGPDTAKNISVNQTLPASVVFVSAAASQGSTTFGAGAVSASLGTLEVGSNATITVVVTPQTAGTIFSTATAGSSETDLNPADNTISVSTIVTPLSADLDISLTANPDPVLLNSILTYTALVANHGPTVASNVTVLTTLPLNVSLSSAASSQGTVASAANLVTASLGTLPVGSNAVVTIQVRPLVLGAISTTASVSSDISDPVLANNTSTVSGTVTAAAELSLSLTGPSSTVVGSNVMYQLTIFNAGPNPATGVNIRDTLGTGLSPIVAISPQGDCTVTGNVVSCLISNLAVGSNATVTITAGTSNLLSSAPVTVTDSAVVTAAQGDPNSANNTATLSTLIAFPTINVVSAGFLLNGESFVPTNGMVDPSELVTFSFRLQNIGNIDTANNLTATLLATNGVASPSASQNYGTLTASGAAVGKTFSFIAAATNGQTITASLQLKNAGTNLSVVTFAFTLPSTNAFANTNDIIIPDQGQGVPYPSVIQVSGVTNLIGQVTVTLTNLNHTFPDDIDMLLVGPGGQNVLLMSHAGYNGVLTNTAVTFDDWATNADGTTKYLPASSQILSGSYAPAQYGTVSFPTNTTPSGPYGTNLAIFNGTSANGNWKLFVYDSDAGDAGSILGGWSLGISSGNVVNPVVDLAVSGKATPNPVLQGSNLTYTFTITNNGPNPASVVQFTNTLPTNVTFVSATNSANTLCATNGAGAVYCTLASLTVGSNVTVTVVVTPNSPGTITAQAAITGSDSDPNQSNNSTTVVATGTSQVADLSLSVVAATNAVVGSNVVYTLTITNNGPGTALGIVISDPLQGILSFSSGSSSGTGGAPFATNGTTFCNVGSLASNASATVTLLLTANQPITVTNVISVSTTSTDTNSANDSVVAVTTFNTPAPEIVATGARLVSGPADGTIAPGQTVTVSLQLANTGSADTAHLKASLQATGGVTSPSGSQAYGALIHGGPAVANNFTFTASGTNGGVITATLFLSDGGTNFAPVTFAFNLPATNSFVNGAGIIIPDHGPATPYPAVIQVSGVTGVVSKVTVTLNQVNHQFPNDLEIMLVSPSGQNVVLMSGAGGSYPTTNAVLTFDDSAPAAVPSSGQFGVGTTAIVSGTFQPTDDGVSQPFPAPAATPPYGSVLSVYNGSDANGAWALYVFDNSPGDGGNIAGGWTLNLTTINPVNSASDMSVSLTKPAGTLYSATPFAFTVSVANKGPADAANVTVLDTLPAGLSYAGTSLGNVTIGAGGSLSFNVGTLSAGATTNFTISVTAANAGAYINAVNVSSDQIDLNSLNNASQVQVVVSAAPTSTLSATASNTGGVFALTLTITGAPGTYSIMASTDLNQWTQVGTVVNTTGTVQFTDPNSASLPSRFYRAAITP